ncbi:MAG TPA: SH3 domain-containing protein [Terriglobales bacterium]|nr:SH3 domain-containing protein [Terriglobales bacterium]
MAAMLGFLCAASAQAGSAQAGSTPARPAPVAESPSQPAREFSFSLAAVQSALQQMGAYRGARLPSLDGFVEAAQGAAPDLQHPYYEFKLDLKPLGLTLTLVGVQASVTAWYADPQGSNSGYQKFKSNGRLESDLLDRLSSFLATNKSTSGVEVEREIEAVRKQQSEAERRGAELEKQLQAAKTSGNTDSTKIYVEAAKAHVPVCSAPESRAPVLLRAEPEDEFEVLQHRGAWLQVRLEAGRSGWVQESLVKSNAAAGGRGPAAEVPPSATPGFTVIRETVSSFSGEWPRLKDKQALYVWARPDGSALTLAAGEKLRFVEHIFMERYRQAEHDSRNSVKGIVVIFLDERGGVAAASLDDIRFWAEGSLTSSAFIKRCSLDPLGAFSGLPVAARREDP